MRQLFIFILVLTFTSFAASAGEYKICFITSDIDSERTDLFIDITPTGSIDSIRLHKSLDDAQIVSNDSYPVEYVMENGIVASERQNREVVILRTEKDFSPAEGGVIILDYLYNGLKNVRKTFRMNLLKTKDRFELATVEDKKVNHLLFRGNRVPVVGVIGIKEIVPHNKKSH